MVTMTKTILTLATTEEEQETAIVDFMFSIGFSNLLVISKHVDVLDIIHQIHDKMDTPCKVLISKGQRTIIVSPTKPEDNLKVIYCRTSMDSFAQALIREYSLTVVFFAD